MSPLEITILLHYYSTVTDFRDGDFSAPAVRQAIDRFYKVDDLLTPTNGVGVLAAHGAAYAITDRGRAFVKALTQMPLPVCVWTIPSHSQGTP